MIDIKLIREKPEWVKKKVKDRGYDPSEINILLKADKEWRTLKEESDKLRARRNEISKKISELKKQKKNADSVIKEAKEIPEKLAETERKMAEAEAKKDCIWQRTPNLQDDSVPIGGAEKNKEVKKWGKIPKFKFPVKGHAELLENLGVLDLKRAAKISGSGFYILRGELATLERALIQFMIDFHVKDGFEEINPPHIVNSKTMFGTGNLPKFESDLYKTKEELYLIPTAEVPVTNIYADEIIEENKLPKKFVSFTQCFRTEAGRHGSETPGIFRLHQFEKVEMVYICRQEDSKRFHEEMVSRAEKILQMLKLPYRKVLLATADAGFASSKTYDLEVWSPALKKYLETSSCSNCTDFQARRMNTKYSENKTGEKKFVHTLNGSGLATPRLLISLVENCQQKDGSIKVPSVLIPYINGKKTISIKKQETKNLERKKRPKQKNKF
jgi:seryl-tRNA synthetase